MDLSTGQKRELVSVLRQQDPYPVAKTCEVVGLARSSFYHHKKAQEEQQLRAAIEAVVQEFPTYGSRRVTAQLRRGDWAVNRKRIQRLMRQMGLQKPRKRRICRTTQSQHPYPRYPNLVEGREVSYPDQVWVSDLTYVRLHCEFVYLAVIMDVFTRSLRGWQLGRSLDQELTLTALKRALTQGRPAIHHSDQGLQYAATSYVELLQATGVAISMAEVGDPRQNGYAERLIRTIKEEEVELSEYRDFAEAYAQIGHFLEEVYQKKRIHSALGYLTPVEFEAEWRHSQVNSCLLTTTELKCVQL